MESKTISSILHQNSAMFQDEDDLRSQLVRRSFPASPFAPNTLSLKQGSMRSLAGVGTATMFRVRRNL